MKIIWLLLFTLFPAPLFAANPADIAVKNYVEAHWSEVFNQAAQSLQINDLYFDDQMDCFSSFSVREEIGFCRLSGSSNSETYSTYLILIKEKTPGLENGELEIKVFEMSRSQL